MLFRTLIIATAKGSWERAKALPWMKVAVTADSHSERWRLPRIELNPRQVQEQTAVEAAHRLLNISPLLYLITHAPNREEGEAQVLLFAYMGAFPQDPKTLTPGGHRWTYIRELPHFRLELSEHTEILRGATWFHQVGIYRRRCIKRLSD